MIKACIFDLDGVIVDTAKYHFIAWRRLANELGFDFDESFNENLKGVSRMESLDLILEHGGKTLSDDEKIEWAEQKNIWYREFITKMEPDEILPGVLPFLDQLKEKGILIALGSASKNASTILDRLELSERFQAIIDGNKTTKSKPDPQVFELGAHQLGVQPNQCIVFEDAAKGIEAALAGGFWAIGVGSQQSLSEADIVIENMEALDFDKLIQELRSKPAR